jgi:16S rRNA (guanine966-N2)-methyltransferase
VTLSWDVSSDSTPGVGCAAAPAALVAAPKFTGSPPRTRVRAGARNVARVALRVIAGTAGGRKLVAPKGGTRPTTDRTKEALFSSLGPARVEGATVLDLYAGSGALAIEALSRGAARAVLVDRAAAAESAIRTNLATTGFTDRARVRRAIVTTFVGGAVPEAPFDLAFLDPPYEVSAHEVTQVLAALADNGLVADGATVVLERAKGSESVAFPARWGIEKERAYGDTLLVVARAA